MRLQARLTIVALAAAAFTASAPAATPPPLLPEPTVAALAAELDGNRAKRDVEFFSLYHRMRASRPFNTAATHIVDQLIPTARSRFL